MKSIRIDTHKTERGEITTNVISRCAEKGIDVAGVVKGTITGAEGATGSTGT